MNLKHFIEEYKTIILVVIVVLALYPLDPTDVLDAGTPLIEIVAGVVTLVLAK